MFREDDIDDFMDNFSPRVFVCLCVDTSDTLSDEQKTEIENGIGRYISSIREDKNAINSVDVAVISYAGTARLLREFSTIAEIDELPVLSNGYSTGTKLNDAVELALEVLEERKQYYVINDIDFYQPELIIIAGSKPDDDISTASEKIRKLENEAALTHFIFSVGDGDFVSELNKLVVSPVGLQEVNRLKDYDFEGFYDRCTLYSEDISDSISHEISSEYEFNDDIEYKMKAWRELTTLQDKHYNEVDQWLELPENDSVLIIPEDNLNNLSDSEVSAEIDEIRKNVHEVLEQNETLVDDQSEFEEVPRDDADEFEGNPYSGEEQYYNDDIETEYMNDVIIEESISISPKSIDIDNEYQEIEEVEYSSDKEKNLVNVLLESTDIRLEHEETIDESSKEQKTTINEIEPYVMEPKILDEEVSIEINEKEESTDPLFVESTLEEDTEMPDEWTIAAQILNAHSEKYGIKSDRISLPIDDDIENDDDLSKCDKHSDNILDSISLYSESEEIISSEINEEYEPEDVEIAVDELDSWDNISYNHKMNENYGLEVIDMDSLTIKLRQLKLNKELLDSNAITVEEFEFVKRQILGDITRG